MADYSSPEPYDPVAAAAYTKVQENKELLERWWGPQKYDREYRKICPKCGVDVRWHWADATSAFLHMDFHARLELHRIG